MRYDRITPIPDSRPLTSTFSLMLTRDERRAVVFLAVVAAAGAVVRVLGGGEGPPGAGVVAPHLAAGDLERQRRLVREAEARARPLGPGERIDADRAGALELERLPRIGPALAQRIVAWRDSHGPFGSLEELGRVPGIGEGMLELLRGHLSFSGTRWRQPDGTVPLSAPRRPVAESGCDDLRIPLALNRATARELACLPGIGGTLAQRIVTDRAARGPYPEVPALARVQGLSRRRIERLQSLLTAP